MAPNCAAKQETRPARTLFPRIYRFSNPRISSFKLPITMTPLLAPSSCQDLQRMPLRKARLANSISQGVRRNPPDGGTPQFPPHRFQISQFSGATLASPAGCRSRRRSMPTTAVIGHLTFGFRSSCERAELMLALVTRVTPVSTLADTFSPFEAASAVLTPS